MPLDDKDLYAVYSARSRFEASIEDVTKRYPVERFAPAAVRMWREFNAGRTGTGASTQHILAQMLEANATYARGHRTMELTPAAFGKLHDHIAGFDDPGLLHFISEDPHVFLYSMAMQQFELRSRVSRSALAECMRIQVLSPGLERQRDRFRETFGFTVQEFVKCAVGVAAVGDIHPDGCFTMSPGFIEQRVPIDPRCMELFLRAASATPAEIGAHYRAARGLDSGDRLSALFAAQAQSIFRTKPVIAMGGDRYCVPFPGLVLSAVSSFLIGMLDDRAIREDLGPAFADHVGSLLRDLPHERLWTERELESLATGEIADFVVRTGDDIVVFEVKNTHLTRRRLSSETIVADGSTSHIRKSATQHLATADDIRSGRFQSLGIPAASTILQFTVTRGDLVIPNSSWYRDRVFTQHFAPKTPPADRHVVPEVIDAASLEKLIAIVRGGGGSLAELTSERAGLRADRWVDWPAFINQKLARGYSTLPSTDAAVDKLFDQLGLPPSADGEP
ncbi:MAG: hypothetical protein JNL80_01285 [Phycisphaerae bacterium]|nr:hypothetical protein [Phycisphaerae bacterium]